jgi:hypothetical protein
MQLRDSLQYILSVVAVLGVAVPAPASPASRPAPVQSALSGPLQQVGLPGDPSALVAVCKVGVTGDPHLTMMYLYPPDDEYYTLLDPESCACPEEEGIAPIAAHVTLDFAEACSIPVTVAIVAADGSNPSCPQPVRELDLCPRVDYNLTVTEAGLYDLSIPLPSGCCIRQAAFLMISFRAVGDCGRVPGLAMQFECNPCVSWNYWPDGALVDLCDGYLLGNPNMYVEATCCSSVPVQPHTWGHVKSMYR